jgi:diaminohydroxyphosphoribosylaminopyrimidine deaminase/5-amino-6-(5-phosphoribosylamino)uracil reductase
MNRCIELAQKGLKSVAPNPLVGCVIVSDGKIIGEGYHMKYGEAHAEVNAINQVKNKELLKKAILYVSLEPCAHFGKTPPCTNLIIEHKIPHVVIGCIDPFAKVAGKGIEKLKASGVKVKVGVLEKEALKLNRRFFTFHEKKRPYIVLKWAQTLDGFIDVIREDDLPAINWITSAQTKQLTDTWRSEEMAILVGKNTVLNDNPNLTVRTILGKSPIRLVIDKENKLPKELNIFDNSQKTVIFNSKVNLDSDDVQYVKIPFEDTLKELLSWLFQNNIQSVLVEGGAYTLQQFINENFWDEARIYTGEVYFNKGVKSPSIKMENFQRDAYGNDQITLLVNKND